MTENLPTPDLGIRDSWQWEPTQRLSCRSRASRRSRFFPSTTSFEALRATRCLCLVDDDNLRISLQAFGLAMSYSVLRTRLESVGAAVDPWTVLTDKAGSRRRANCLRRSGWNVLQLDREVRATPRGLEVNGNADHELVFLAGMLTAKRPFDSVLLGTGDGDLAVSLARSLKELASVPVTTISVMGSSSHRLADQTLFSGRILVGRDLTTPIRPRRFR